MHAAGVDMGGVPMPYMSQHLLQQAAVAVPQTALMSAITWLQELIVAQGLHKIKQDQINLADCR